MISSFHEHVTVSWRCHSVVDCLLTHVTGVLHHVCLVAVGESRSASLSPLTAFKLCIILTRYLSAFLWVKVHSQSLFSPILTLYMVSNDVNLALQLRAQKVSPRDHRAFISAYWHLGHSRYDFSSPVNQVYCWKTLAELIRNCIEAWKSLRFLCFSF